jgi:glycyl-tRNA synthetase
VKKDGLAEIGIRIAKDLRSDLSTFYDESGSVGRRYRRQDEIGTPWCVTVDYQTKEDNTVTIRERDSMQQVRMLISELSQWFADKL